MAKFYLSFKENPHVYNHWKWVLSAFLLTGWGQTANSQELTTNGDAEITPVMSNGWSRDPNFTTTDFGYDTTQAGAGPWFLPSSNGYFTTGAEHGNYFFSTGYTATPNVANAGSFDDIQQSIDVSAYTTTNTSYTFTAYWAAGMDGSLPEFHINYEDGSANTVYAYDTTMTTNSDLLWHSVSYTQSVLATDAVAQVQIYMVGNSSSTGSVNTFFDFLSLTATPTPLPVTLLDFYADQRTDGTVDLLWQTSMEQNSHYFAIQRSADGKTFETIGQLEAAGNSEKTLNYSYIDQSPLEGNNFYRLQMVDLDDKYKYSQIVEVNSSASGKQLEVFNNPFHDQISLRVNENASDQLMLTLTDLQGRTVLRQAYGTQAGNNFINLYPSGTMTSGIYLLTIRGNSVNQTVKLLKE